MDDSPFLKITVELDSYLIANLLAALELVPPTGDWYNAIIQLIEDGIAAAGQDPLTYYYRPNFGMNIKQVRHHLFHLEHSEKYNPDAKQRRFAR